jgi:RNA polymerase sigma factor (sigma-70 family)
MFHSFQREGYLEPDQKLIASIADGDQEALALVYARHNSLLYSTALRILGDPTAAEETIQDTFFQLWQNAGKFDSARGSLTGWLLVITRSRALSRLRKTKRERFSNDENLVILRDLSQSALELQVARQLVSSALSGLPAPQRDAITLAYFEGLTCTEIAIRTRVPVSTAKTRLRTGLQGMKKVITQLAKPEQNVTLDDILVTQEIFSRALRTRSVQHDFDSLRVLEEAASVSPAQLVDRFLQLALDLCYAGTAGLSFLERTSNGKQIFRWTNLAGRLQSAVGGTTPRDFSPCGVTLDRNTPQLFSYPARYFHYFNDVPVPIVEGLVIPFHVGETSGTVWIVSHDEQSTFDSEDVRIMCALTEYAGAGFHLSRTLRS